MNPDLPMLFYMGGISIAILVIECVIMLLICGVGGAGAAKGMRKKLV